MNTAYEKVDGGILMILEAHSPSIVRCYNIGSFGSSSHKYTTILEALVAVAAFFISST